MSDEQTPSVEELKAKLQAADEIPVEEEPAAKSGSESVDIAEELRKVGKQFAETMQTAWNSEERQRMETEVRDGVRSFVAELDKVFGDIRESDAMNKVRTEAVELKDKVDTTEVSQKTKNGVVGGLRWLSDELGKLADRFAPVEKSPEPEDVVEEAAEAEETE